MAKKKKDSLLAPDDGGLLNMMGVGGSGGGSTGALLDSIFNSAQNINPASQAKGIADVSGLTGLAEMTDKAAQNGLLYKGLEIANRHKGQDDPLQLLADIMGDPQLKDAQMQSALTMGTNDLKPMSGANMDMYGTRQADFDEATEYKLDDIGHRGSNISQDEANLALKEMGRRVNTMPLYKPAKPIYDKFVSEPHSVEEILEFLKEWI